jgi:hypothetical protein
VPAPRTSSPFAPSNSAMARIQKVAAGERGRAGADADARLDAGSGTNSGSVTAGSSGIRTSR